MTLWSYLFVVLFVFSTAAMPVRAFDSVLAGSINGVESCSQKTCGVTIFTGSFVGNPGDGFFTIIIKYDQWPNSSMTHGHILGGNWNLNITTPLSVSYAGSVIRNSGTLSPGDGASYGTYSVPVTTPLGSFPLNWTGYQTYLVTAVLCLDKGGTGAIGLSAILDHTVIPPRLTGSLIVTNDASCP